MRKVLFIVGIFVTGIVAVCVSGCGASTSTNTVHTMVAQVAPVSLTITDEPPAGVSVLFFQVNLTAASLQPTSGTAISLLPNNTPIPIDVSQLQALSAFLNTANIAAGSYSSLSLTFANPQLVIFNNSNATIAGNCAVGSVCRLTPSIDNTATIDLSSSPFPLTVAALEPLGLLIDFHLNSIIQSDLSVNLGAANGVSVTELQTPTSPVGPPPFGAVTGSVTVVGPTAGQFTLQTPDGRTFTVSTSSATSYDDFPASACAAASLSCIAAGEIVQVQVSSVQFSGSGVLAAARVTYVQAAAEQTVVGTIVAIPPLPLPAGETVLQLILHQSPTGNGGLPLGGMATVAVWAPGSGSNTTTAFSLDANGFVIPSGYTFASVNDVVVGQTVQVTVTPGSLIAPVCTNVLAANGWGLPCGLSFTASSVQLEPSQITGSVSAIASSSSSFTLNSIYAPSPLNPLLAPIQYNVLSTSQTGYQGFSTDSFSGLAANDLVSVNGWLFPVSGAGSKETVVAQAVVLHGDGNY
jgi:hypothetical protein